MSVMCVQAAARRACDDSAKKTAHVRIQSYIPIANCEVCMFV